MNVSVYIKGALTPEIYIKNIKRISAAFPSLQKEFYDLLSELVKEKQYSDNKLTDAVNFVIENCKYPHPSIADFLSYDKGFTLYTYTNILKFFDSIGSSVWNDYKQVEIEGVSLKVWASIIDIQKYNLQCADITNK
jgi:hypothetical protein